MRQVLGHGALRRPEGSEREGGGRGDRDGNTCKPMAVSFQCMTKPTTMKKNTMWNKDKYHMTSFICGI